MCASSVQAYVLPLQANTELRGDLAEAKAFRLASRSLNDASQAGSISVPMYKRHGALHPDVSKRDPEVMRSWAFRQGEIMKAKYGATAAHQKRQTIGLTDVGPDRYVRCTISISSFHLGG